MGVLDPSPGDSCGADSPVCRLYTLDTSWAQLPVTSPLLNTVLQRASASHHVYPHRVQRRSEEKSDRSSVVTQPEILPGKKMTHLP